MALPYGKYMPLLLQDECKERCRQLEPCFLEEVCLLSSAIDDCKWLLSQHDVFYDYDGFTLWPEKYSNQGIGVTRRSRFVRSIIKLKEECEELLSKNHEKESNEDNTWPALPKLHGGKQLWK